MGGLIAFCILLGMVCAGLLLYILRHNRRIRSLAQQTDSGETLEVPLREGDLARLQNSILNLQQALQRQKVLTAEEACRTGQLTADISHQLKTPLTTLKLYTEMDAGPHMEGCLEQINRMETLIQSLLRLERLCADGYTFHFAQADVRRVIGEQWESLQPAYPEKRLHLQGTATILCDRQWLGEAFGNLLKNACEHTSQNGEIWVQLQRTDTLFLCTLEDNGGGVKDSEVPKLFQRFYRAEHCAGNGAGIGLAIVKEIIHRHHGTIVAENGRRGLKMTVTLPMLDATLTNI